MPQQKSQMLIYQVDIYINNYYRFFKGIDCIKISIEDNPYARLDQYFDMVADKIRSVKVNLIIFLNQDLGTRRTYIGALCCGCFTFRFFMHYLFIKI